MAPFDSWDCKQCSGLGAQLRRGGPTYVQSLTPYEIDRGWHTAFDHEKCFFPVLEFWQSMFAKTSPEKSCAKAETGSLGGVVLQARTRMPGLLNLFWRNSHRSHASRKDELQ
eukprot:2494490-Amphidinium_carterae.1